MSTLLVPIDFSDITPTVMSHTEILAESLNAEVYLLHVEAPDPDFVGYEVGPDTVRDSVAEGIHSDKHAIHRLRDDLRSKNLRVESLTIQGGTVAKIVEEAIRLQADYIVMGSHGHGALLHLLMGSVCEGVIKDAPCPVVVIPATP